MPHRLARKVRLGRRGLVLVLVGVCWVLLGISVILTPYSSQGWVPHEEIPGWARGSVWIITGCVGIVTAWWPPGKDRWGFAAIVLMPLERAASFAVAAVGWALPGIEHGAPRGWISALIWSAVVALIMLITGWQEPPSNRGRR